MNSPVLSICSCRVVKSRGGIKSLIPFDGEGSVWPFNIPLTESSPLSFLRILFAWMKWLASSISFISLSVLLWRMLLLFEDLLAECIWKLPLETMTSWSEESLGMVPSSPSQLRLCFLLGERRGGPRGFLCWEKACRSKQGYKWSRGR